MQRTLNILSFLLLCLLANIFFAMNHVKASDGEYDLLIIDGFIIDGSGKEKYKADLGIKDGRIISIGNLNSKNAHKIIKADGMVIAPGFIDLHSHADNNILKNPDAENIIRQGITTILGGNCGFSPLPIHSFMTALEDKGMSLNMGLLVGHNTIRKAVLGNGNRTPTNEEMHKMKALMSAAMTEGAFGLSTGLKYVPGVYAKKEEVITLAKVSRSYHGFYATHMRDEGEKILASMEESLEIGRKAEIPVHISHHKLVGKPMWGKSHETLKKIEQARGNGLEVTLDQYPYTASSTTLAIIFPAWALAGGDGEIRKRLDDPGLRAKIKEGVIYNLLYDRGGGEASRIFISSFPAEPSLTGKNLAEITVLKGKKDTIENAAEILMDMVYAGGGNGIFHAMNEDDVINIMRAPYVSIATDGSAPAYGQDSPHPRNYGTFPRVLHKYVKNKHILSLEEAVNKMSGLPAQRLGVTDRGLLKENMMADIVIFNPDKVRDLANWINPHQYPEGIPYVIVNGILVIDNNQGTRNFPGKILKHTVSAK